MPSTKGNSSSHRGGYRVITPADIDNAHSAAVDAFFDAATYDATSVAVEQAGGTALFGRASIRVELRESQLKDTLRQYGSAAVESAASRQLYQKP